MMGRCGEIASCGRTKVLIVLLVSIMSIRFGAQAWVVHPTRLSFREAITRSRPISGATRLSSRPSRIGIVGGGLAGLSTAYHLLKKAPDTNITIFDKAPVGQGGASSVAGGLLHPLSPKGKLVHLGLEGLEATNALLSMAKDFQESCILQDEIYRVAVNADHVEVLKETAESLPELAEWLPRGKIPWEAPVDVLGALRLHSGCKVVHVPSYLIGLFQAIESIGSGQKEWVLIDENSSSSPEAAAIDREQLAGFDAVVLCAGSGMFHNSIIQDKMPMQLVRGQSIEMTLKSVDCNSAMLCGKYISPLLEKDRILIGATHEFKEVALSPAEVESELRDRSEAFASYLWEDGVVDRITSGVRVQCNRGQHGRVPIIGRLDSPLHDNSWIFTGLSSRGLLHHGLYGEILACQILGLDCEQHHDGTDWWQSKVTKQS